MSQTKYGPEVGIKGSVTCIVQRLSVLSETRRLSVVDSMRRSDGKKKKDEK